MHGNNLILLQFIHLSLSHQYHTTYFDLQNEVCKKAEEFLKAFEVL